MLSQTVSYIATGDFRRFARYFFVIFSAGHTRFSCSPCPDSLIGLVLEYLTPGYQHAVFQGVDWRDISGYMRRSRSMKYGRHGRPSLPSLNQVERKLRRNVQPIRNGAYLACHNGGVREQQNWTNCGRQDARQRTDKTLWCPSKKVRFKNRESSGPMPRVSEDLIIDGFGKKHVLLVVRTQTWSVEFIHSIQFNSQIIWYRPP